MTRYKNINGHVNGEKENGRKILGLDHWGSVAVQSSIGTQCKQRGYRRQLMVDWGGYKDKRWLLVDKTELNLEWWSKLMDAQWWEMSWRQEIERNCCLVWRVGRPSWKQQSCEEIVQDMVSGIQQLPHIYQAALFYYY